MHGISVVIPTLDEAENIDELISRFFNAFNFHEHEFELIFIDDHSTDGTKEIIQRYVDSEPRISVHEKVGKKGKATSLLQGFELAKFDRIGYIDADLQYPPEIVPEMLERLDRGFDIVVADRLARKNGMLRAFTGRVFHILFAKYLHGFACDVQSGCKVFKRRIAHEVNIQHLSLWAFDLEFLLAARNYGYVIGSMPVEIEPRKAGRSKLSFFPALFEIGWNALILRFSKRPPLLIHPENIDNGSMMGAGIAHNGKRFVTHTTLHHQHSAFETVHNHQKLFMLALLGIVWAGVLLDTKLTLIILVATLSFLYFVDLLFNLFLIVRSFRNSKEVCITKKNLALLDNVELPTYTIFCPLYKEWQVIPQFTEAISKLDWPKDKLDVQLLLEEDDPETIAEAEKMRLPEYFRIVVVPHSMPKTKPKACNYGLSHAKGEFAVIYDAEDVPDPDQLKKAYLTFHSKGNEDIICAQAKLNFYNARQNVLTRLFSAEYALWFDLVLTGLQSISSPIPLGGTSNHFRTDDLRRLQGWDPFNVTEDCDLGIRITKIGRRTVIFNSSTMEEATSRPGNWMRQRSRWIKGYMQTYLVHMRRPKEFLSDLRNPHVLTFQLVVGGKVLSMVINPFMWLITILYFSYRAVMGPYIEPLFPGPVLYVAVFSLVFGNFLYFYYYMIGCAKREQWDLVKYVFLVPFYWLMMSVASWKAFFQLIFKPHYWEKTQHGFHLTN